MSIRPALFEGMQKVLFPARKKRVQFLSDRSLRASNRLRNPDSRFVRVGSRFSGEFFLQASRGAGASKIEALLFVWG